MSIEHAEISIKYVEMHQAYKTGMTRIAWQTEIQNDVVRTSYWNWCNQNDEEQTKKTPNKHTEKSKENQENISLF